MENLLESLRVLCQLLKSSNTSASKQAKAAGGKGEEKLTPECTLQGSTCYFYILKEVTDLMKLEIAKF